MTGPGMGGWSLAHYATLREIELRRWVEEASGGGGGEGGEVPVSHDKLKKHAHVAFNRPTFFWGD